MTNHTSKTPLRLGFLALARCLQYVLSVDIEMFLGGRVSDAKNGIIQISRVAVT